MRIPIRRERSKKLGLKPVGCGSRIAEVNRQKNAKVPCLPAPGRGRLQESN